MNIHINTQSCQNHLPQEPAVVDKRFVLTFRAPLPARIISHVQSMKVGQCQSQSPPGPLSLSPITEIQTLPTFYTPIYCRALIRWTSLKRFLGCWLCHLSYSTSVNLFTAAFSDRFTAPSATLWKTFSSYRLLLVKYWQLLLLKIVVVYGHHMKM